MLLSILLAACAPAPQPAAPTEPVKTLSTAATAGPAETNTAPTEKPSAVPSTTPSKEPTIPPTVEPTKGPHVMTRAEFLKKTEVDTVIDPNDWGRIDYPQKGTYNQIVAEFHKAVNQMSAVVLADMPQDKPYKVSLEGGYGGGKWVYVNGADYNLLGPDRGFMLHGVPTFREEITNDQLLAFFIRINTTPVLVIAPRGEYMKIPDESRYMLRMINHENGMWPQPIVELGPPKGSPQTPFRKTFQDDLISEGVIDVNRVKEVADAWNKGVEPPPGDVVVMLGSISASGHH